MTKSSADKPHVADSPAHATRDNGPSENRLPYFESFDDGCGGWLADRGSALPVWEGVAYCHGPWYLDYWHAKPGAGYLHLLMTLHTHASQLHEYYPGYPGNRFVEGNYSTDWRDARLSVRLRGDMDLKGAQLLVLVQGEHADGAHSNYVLTGQPLNVTCDWSEQRLNLTTDPDQWLCLGSRHDRERYGPAYVCRGIENVLRDVNVDIIFVLFPLTVVPVEEVDDPDRLRAGVDYHVEQASLPKGLIMFDWVKLEYA
jgi:hypothetical protein